MFLTNNGCPDAGRMWVGGKNESVRDPLVVSTSVDGHAFTSSRSVMTCHDPAFRCGGRIDGRSKSPGPSYPQAVTVTAPAHMAGLYVVATMNKEDVVVVRVPFSSL